MSENQSRGRDLARYDEMETQALEELLRLDAEAPEGQESDTETILYITEVIAKRERTSITGNAAQTAWESFQQDYLSAEEDCETVKPAVGKSGKTWLTRLTAAAAVVALLIFVPVAAKALGWEDIWNAVAKWAKETFSFVSGWDAASTEPSEADARHYRSLQEVLTETNITADLIPNWIPEGYELEQVVVDENPKRRSYIAFYKNGGEALKVAVQSYLNGNPEKIEIDDTLLEIYEVSGVEYYIFENMEQVRAVWTWDSYECYISGELTVDEIKTMIDSIGKG